MVKLRDEFLSILRNYCGCSPNYKGCNKYAELLLKAVRDRLPEKKRMSKGVSNDEWERRKGFNKAIEKTREVFERER